MGRHKRNVETQTKKDKKVPMQKSWQDKVNLSPKKKKEK